jgi:hypothetical protein
MIEVRQRGARFYFEGIVDPDEAISRLRIRERRSTRWRFSISAGCVIGHSLRAPRFSASAKVAPTSSRSWPRWHRFRKLTGSLSKKILPSGELDDRASPQLAAIRRELATTFAHHSFTGKPDAPRK